MPFCHNFLNFHDFCTFAPQFCCRVLRTFFVNFFWLKKNLPTFCAFLMYGWRWCRGVRGWCWRRNMAGCIGPKFAYGRPVIWSTRHCTYLASFPFRVWLHCYSNLQEYWSLSMCVCSLAEQNIWQSCPPHPPNLTQAASHLCLLHPVVLLQKDLPEASESVKWAQ